MCLALSLLVAGIDFVQNFEIMETLYLFANFVPCSIHGQYETYEAEAAHRSFVDDARYGRAVSTNEN